MYSSSLNVDDWNALCSIEIQTIDMHTGGEPLRVILNGYPPILGNTILEKRQYCKTHLDHLRKLLMHEPRGHADMYGCLIVPPNNNGADFGIIFMHNEGYSTMCGHATIAIAKLAVQLGWVTQEENPENTQETKVTIDAPCGRLVAYVGATGTVRFINVPSFVLYDDCNIEIEPYGKVPFTIAYGGAFYAYFDVSDFGLEINSENVETFKQINKSVKQQISDKYRITHPFEDELSFLYGSIFIEAVNQKGIHSKNVCILADEEVDRCPTGSGVSGRIAIHMKKAEVKLNEEIVIESITGSTFSVSAIEKTTFGHYNAYIPEVKGDAYVTGKHTFILEKGDVFPEGFLL